MALARALIAALHAAGVVIARLNGFVNRRQQAHHHIVSGALGDHAVELEIIRRVILAVQIGVIHPIQQGLHRGKLLFLPPDGGQRRDVRLDQQPRLQQLGDQLLLIGEAQPQRVARQPRHGAQERALPLPDIDDMLRLQNFNRLAHRRTADPEALHQFRLGRELRARLERFLYDHFPQLIGHLLRELPRFSDCFHCVRLSFSSDKMGFELYLRLRFDVHR